MRSTLRSLRLAVPVLCLALTLGSQPGRAQDASALLAFPKATMQDMENGALRNAITRVSTGPDAAATGAQGNLFAGLQQGNDNRIDATQTGIGNVIRITQIGDMQSAVINQSGSFNRAVVRQGR